MAHPISCDINYRNRIQKIILLTEIIKNPNPRNREASYYQNLRDIICLKFDLLPHKEQLSITYFSEAWRQFFTIADDDDLLEYLEQQRKSTQPLLVRLEKLTSQRSRIRVPGAYIYPHPHASAAGGVNQQEPNAAQAVTDARSPRLENLMKTLSKSLVSVAEQIQSVEALFEEGTPAAPVPGLVEDLVRTTNIIRGMLVSAVKFSASAEGPSRSAPGNQ